MTNFFKKNQKQKGGSPISKAANLLNSDFRYKPSPMLLALAPIQQDHRVTEDKYINIKE